MELAGPFDRKLQKHTQKDAVRGLFKEVKGMASNNEVIFQLWLSENISTGQLSELYQALDEIEQ